MKLDQAQAELYTQAGWANEYEFHPGVLILPVAEAPPTDPVLLAKWSPVVAVPIHAPYRSRNVTYSARKTNSPPMLPTPTDSGAFKFVGGSVAVPYPTLAINGLYEWDATAQYTFVSTCGDNKPGDGLVLGAPPFVTTLQAQNALSGGNLAGAPADVVQSGVGPKAGYSIAQTLNVNDPNYSYSEPTFLPAIFFSTDCVSGPASYPAEVL